jgi:transcriptional regulator with XRE-family HTH domain
MTVRDQIRAAYLASGLTQGQIAARAGLSESTVLNVMRGRNVTVDVLVAVAVVLGVESLCLPRGRSAQPDATTR